MSVPEDTPFRSYSSIFDDSDFVQPQPMSFKATKESESLPETEKEDMSTEYLSEPLRTKSGKKNRRRKGKDLKSLFTQEAGLPAPEADSVLPESSPYENDNAQLELPKPILKTSDAPVFLREKDLSKEFAAACKTNGILPRDEWKSSVAAKYHAEEGKMTKRDISLIVFGMELYKRYNVESEVSTLFTSLVTELQGIKVAAKELNDTREVLTKIPGEIVSAVKAGVKEGTEMGMDYIETRTKVAPKGAPKVDISKPMSSKMMEQQDESSDESSDNESEESEEESFETKAAIFLALIKVPEEERDNAIVLMALRAVISDSELNQAIRNDRISSSVADMYHQKISDKARELMGKGKTNKRAKQPKSSKYASDYYDDAL
uniref:Putative phosphoprotein n=1 Tax=Rice stripe mosaic virus TaxID=1931356 RepID=A0A3G6VA16_9RHAB|nr:putative phosphoprotein [Rice stripe mosaic virus]